VKGDPAVNKQHLNEKTPGAITNLLCNGNFGKRDLAVDLSYDDDQLPATLD
jgi:hypothetical protein